MSRLSSSGFVGGGLFTPSSSSARSQPFTPTRVPAATPAAPLATPQQQFRAPPQRVAGTPLRLNPAQQQQQYNVPQPLATLATQDKMESLVAKVEETLSKDTPAPTRRAISSGKVGDMVPYTSRLTFLLHFVLHGSCPLSPM